jgi:hypothetical protein
MLDRYVLIKLKDEYTSADRLAEVIDETTRVLQALPGVVKVRVGRAADETTARDWDLSIIVRFENLAAIETYKDHPDHRAYVDDFLKPKLSAIRAWNFVVEAE